MQRSRIVLSLALAAAYSQSFAQTGSWSTNSNEWNVLAIHMILLPNKKLLIMNRSREGTGGENTYHMELISEPYTSGGTTFEPTVGSEVHELFCAGHSLDENGNVIFAGGHDGIGSAGNNHGMPDLWMYKWSTDQLVQMAEMSNGRWYPTVLQTPDRTFIFNMGSRWNGTSAVENDVAELWTLAGTSDPEDYLHTLSQSSQNVYYPHMFVHPGNGQAYFAASGRPGSGVDGGQPARLLNPATLAWDQYATIPTSFANVRHFYPSGVMMDGVIYRSGGSALNGTDPQNSDNVAVKSTVKLDLNAGTPAWSALADMNQERKNHTLVALPDGRILAMGGCRYHETPDSEERATPEAFDTEAPSLGWIEQAVPSTVVGRGYHSTALLLPNGTVVFAGGEPEGNTSWNTLRKAQFFTPDYGGSSSWQANRPVISSTVVPTSIRYGEDFDRGVSVATGRTLSKVRLISLGATTHAFNENQQFVTLNFTPHPTISGQYIVSPPTSTFKATPGYYMLFAVDSQRVPSIAAIVQLKDYARSYPTSVTVGSGTTATTTPALDEAYLGDNRYLGTRLDSYPNDPSYAGVTIQGSVPAPYTKVKVRLTVEARTTISTTYRWYLKNYSTSSYDEVKSGTLGSTDTIITDAFTASGTSPYVSSTGQMEAFLEWRETQGDSFSVYVDRVEFGAR